MSGTDDILLEITPQVLLKAYACGIFPMAETADDPSIFWVEPEMRGILPLDAFHIPKSLKKAFRKSTFKVVFNKSFMETVSACAEQTDTRRETWINSGIKGLYSELHAMGHAHSVEVYEGEELVGGLYGVRLGRAFFGESMFSRRTNASKIALIHLVYEMRRAGFVLLDTQFTTAHLEKFGVIEVPKNEYHVMLEAALKSETHFLPQDGGATSDSILQLLSQTS